MSQRAKLAISILALAAGFSAMIPLSAASDAIPAKTRMLAGLVQPLVHAFGANGAIGILMGFGLASAAAIWAWPMPDNPKRSRPVRTEAAAPAVAPAPRARSLASMAEAGARYDARTAAPQPSAAGGIPQRDALLQAIAAGAQAELDHLDQLRDERAQAGPPAPGIGEARYRPIVFCEHLPPKDGTWLSYYGGKPTVPPGFAWPVSANDRARPIHFLMQWDCRHLAQQDATGLLPRDGVLYCFMDYADKSPFDARFIHCPAPVEDWRELDPPAALGPISCAYDFPYCSQRTDEAKSHLPVAMPRWTFQPVAIDYPKSDPALADPEDPESGDWFWNEYNGIEQELMDVQARVSGAVSAGERQVSRELERPFPRFPHDWSAIRVIAARALDDLRDGWALRVPGAIGDMDDDAKNALIEQWRAEAGELFAFAARYDLSGAVPQSVADDVWAWCEKVAPALYLRFDGIVQDAVNASLGLRSAALDALPPEWIGRIATRHALAYHYEGRSRARCPNRIFGPPSYVQGYVEEQVIDHMLLLEMSSTDGIGFHLGEGVIQCMIKPDDLRERRFDKVVVIASAY